MANQRKLEWQRNQRRLFKEKYGYSTSSYYATGGLREKVLKRDNYKCCLCGMTAGEHIEKWGRPITLDHKDRNKKNNTMENLWTLCLSCHGSKDISPYLIKPKAVKHKETILSMRENGYSYQDIADILGFSVATIWKWVRIWTGVGKSYPGKGVQQWLRTVKC